MKFEALKEFTTILIQKPWTIFVFLTLVYGYLYWDQTDKLQGLLTEVGGLRVEQQKMNEIIKLKVQIIKLKECS